MFNPAVGNYDVDDLRQSGNAAVIFPYEYYVGFLQREDVMAKIGAEAVYAECPNGPYDLFVKTGDVGFWSFFEWCVMRVFGRTRGTSFRL